MTSKQIFFNPFVNSDRNTISNTISKELIFDTIDEVDIIKLKKKAVNTESFSVWGTTIESTWGKMTEDDLIIFVDKMETVFFAKILYKCISDKLDDNIWGGNKEWKYIYFLKDVKEISIPLGNLKKFADYKKNYTFRGLSRLHPMRTLKFLDEFYFDIFINDRIEGDI